MHRSLAAVGAALALLATSVPASAAGMKFKAGLSGDQQVPPVVTGASGKVTVKFDDALTKADVKLSMSNITGVTLIHFHCHRPGHNGTVAFNLVPTPCTLSNNSISCTVTNADVQANSCLSEIGREVNNIAALAFAMRDGLIYTNVHTGTFTSGELRGQMVGK